MLISTALLLDSNIRNSVWTPAKLPCGRVVEGLDRNFDVLIVFGGARKNVMVTSIPMLPFFFFL
jgi:hypothetical protein